MKQREFHAAKKKRVSRSKKDRRRFYDKQKRRCWYCGETVKKKAFRLEHQVPFSRGGSCKLSENIVLACERCDSEKGAKTVEQYRWFMSKVLQRDGIEFFGESGRMLNRDLHLRITCPMCARGQYRADNQRILETAAARA